MATSNGSFINYIDESKRLKSKYADAEMIVAVSDIYPDVSLDNDGVIACRRDNSTGRLVFYEEKSLDEVLNTSVVPIQYHSIYGKAVASRIRNLMVENEDFYQTFLSKVTKIVLDSNAADSPGKLVIRNYTSNLGNTGYTKDDLVRQILSSYGIEEDDELVQDLLTGFNNSADTRQALDYYKVMTEGKFDTQELAAYYVSNKMYKELKYLLENKKNEKKVAKKVISDDPCSYLNTVFDYFPEVVVDNADILKPAIDEMVMINKNKEKFGDEKSYIPVEKKDALVLTKILIRELDPSGKLANKFDMALKTGKLLIYDENDVSTGYSAFKEKSNGELERINLEEDFNFKDYILMTSNGSLTDVFELMHGFFEYVSTPLGGKVVDDYNFIMATAPSYFEARTSELLIKHGFNKDEVRRVFNVRKSDCLGTGSIGNTPILVDLVNKYKEHNGLNQDCVLSDNEVERTMDFRKKQGAIQLDEKTLKRRYVSGCANSYFEADEKLDYLTIGEALGYALAKDSNPTMDERMLSMCENVGDVELSAHNLVTMLRTGDYVEKEINSAEMERMFAESQNTVYSNRTNVHK